MRHLSLALSAVALFAAVGCAPTPSASSGASAPRADRNLLTPDQFRAGGYQNAYDAVAALRPSWLTARGPDSFNTPSEVIAYLDNARLGGVEALRGIHLSSVQAIRHYDAGQATARWGVGHAQGAVQVVTEATRPAPNDR